MSLFDLLQEHAIAHNDLLHKNDARGDVFSSPRDVDFAFKTPDKQRAEDLCEFINCKNYGRAKVRNPSSGEDLYWVIAIIQMPINQYVLCSVSGFMVCLSRLFQVEYDGWGSVIQTSKPKHG